MWTVVADVAAFVGTFPFRGAVRNEPGGNVAVVQLKDASRLDGEFGLAVPRVANHDRRYDRYLLQPGDVLVQARGRHPAGIVELRDPAIAAPGLHALRADPRRLTPAYLSWALNHSKTQGTIASVAQGTHAPFLSKQALMELRIPVPPLPVQHQITDVIRTREHERQLANQLAAAQDALVEGKTWAAAMRDIEGAA
jgi:hypothetical protein